MKAQKWIERPHPDGTWVYGLVRDEDGVIKVVEWLMDGGMFGIVGRQNVDDDTYKAHRLDPGEKDCILANLFFGIGVYFGIAEEDLRAAMIAEPEEVKQDD